MKEEPDVDMFVVEPFPLRTILQQTQRSGLRAAAGVRHTPSTFPRTNASFAITPTPIETPSAFIGTHLLSAETRTYTPLASTLPCPCSCSVAIIVVVLKL